MTPLLYSVSISALLSTTSLLAVVLRVSPLTSPGYAIPAFFASMLLSITSIGVLLFYFFWNMFPVELWDAGKTWGIALRQGVFLGVATCIVFLFLMLQILTWWAAILIFAVFVLIELALQS